MQERTDASSSGKGWVLVSGQERFKTENTKDAALKGCRKQERQE